MSFTVQWLYKKLSPACKFACGIRELHATPIMFYITVERTKIRILKNSGYVKKIPLIFAILIFSKSYPASTHTTYRQI
jgi:hypothetical protein